jgi:hypothetical protein
MFTILTAAIFKCNELICREVLLKEERSTKVCWMLACFPVVQILCTLLILHRQKLWRNFILVPSSIDGVSWGLMCFATSLHACI